MSGRGIQAGVNGFMNGFNFVHGIQRQDALDAERRANRKADIQHRNDREAVTDSHWNKTYGLQQETATYNRDRQDSLDAERRANREEDTKRQNDHWEKTYNAQQDAAAQKELENNQVQIAGWTYYALEDLANAKTQEERERISGTIAKGINQLPIFQKLYGVGGDTGRNATGIELLPNGLYSVTIHNEHTGTTGPMTNGASADKNDTVFTINPAQVASVAGIKIGGEAKKPKPIPANILKLVDQEAEAALKELKSNFNYFSSDELKEKMGGLTDEEWKNRWKKPQLAQYGYPLSASNGKSALWADAPGTQTGAGKSKQAKDGSPKTQAGIVNPKQAKDTPQKEPVKSIGAQLNSSSRPPSPLARAMERSLIQKEDAGISLPPSNGLRQKLTKQTGPDQVSIANDALNAAQDNLAKYMKERRGGLPANADPQVYELKRKIKNAEGTLSMAKKKELEAKAEEDRRFGINKLNSTSVMGGM